MNNTENAKKMIGLLTKLMDAGRYNADTATIDEATALIAENKTILRDTMKEKLARITIAAQKAAKTINKHKSCGKPNMDKIACLFGFEPEINDVFNFFTEADKDEKEQSALIMNLLVTVKTMVSTGKFDKVPFIPKYPPLTDEEKKSLAIEEAKNMVIRITEASNRAIRSVNRHLDRGETEACEWKLRAVVGYGTKVKELEAYFTALGTSPEGVSGESYDDELAQLKLCTTSADTIQGFLNGTPISHMDELPFYKNASEKAHCL